MKKILSMLAVLALLMSMVMVVSADSAVIESEVVYSITDGTDEEVGLGVAFLYTMNMNDVVIYGKRTFNGATINVDGQTCKVVRLGAIVTNQAETASNPDAMVRENVTGRKLVDVEATRLWDGWNDTQLQYAVRVTNVPAKNKKDQIYCRPYFIYENASGEEVVEYGNTTNKSYFSGWCDIHPVKLPDADTPVDANDEDERVVVSKAEIVDRTVTLTLTNYAEHWTIEENSTVEYICQDGNGVELEKVSWIGAMDVEESKSFTFEVPDETTLITLGDANITYKLMVTLPAIGTDIDVTKKKNRIRVSAASIVDNTVSLTFTNYTTNWITEETDYVEYTCYDADGNILDAAPNSTAKVGTIYIGCIDTKKNKSKTFTFIVPEGTAVVRLTKSKIVYWTEWS